ncbi:DUF2357 domain-containing protein [Bacteroidota bacterium]
MDSLLRISPEEADQFGEAEIQLCEGYSYEYQIGDGFKLAEIPGIVKRSRRSESSGRITPGIYVGSLVLDVIELRSGEKTGEIPIEVRSVKASYREDYRHMLEDITQCSTELILQYNSPVLQKYTPVFSADAKTNYQKFAFVKSIIDSDEFHNAVYKIISAPLTFWSHVEEETDIRRAQRIGNKQIRQIASRQKRINLPGYYPLGRIMQTVPEEITVAAKTETVDTPENRFVKYALEQFSLFCSEFRAKVAGGGDNHLRAAKEAFQAENKLNQFLGYSLFKEISPPEYLPLNSPSLQRKEGYREILRAWLMFELASRLVWQGGDDVYTAGKRDVATLYEYWIFFKMLNVMKEVFSIEPNSIEQLICPTANELGLTIRSGKYTCLKGIYAEGSRDLNIEFSYNRTFSGGGFLSESRELDEGDASGLYTEYLACRFYS